MEYKSAFSCISPLTRLDDIEEIVSDSLDQSLHSSFVKGKLNPPYSSHSYSKIFDVYTILNQSLSPPPPGLDNAICSCPQFDGSHTIQREFPPGLASFPEGFRRWLRCFVHPMLLPIPSPLPLPNLSKPQSGWEVNLNGDVFLNELDPCKWTQEML